MTHIEIQSTLILHLFTILKSCNTTLIAFADHNTEVIMKRQLCTLTSVDSDSKYQKVETMSNTLVTPLFQISSGKQ